MTINSREIIEAISIVADERNMRVTMRQAAKGSLICAATAFIGGLLLGPAGLAVGGTLGGIAGMAATKGTFKPVSEIIRYDLTEGQRQELVERIVNAVREIDASDVAVLASLILTSGAIKEAALRTVISFVNNELRLQIVD